MSEALVTRIDDDAKRISNALKRAYKLADEAGKEHIQEAAELISQLLESHVARQAENRQLLALLEGARSIATDMQMQRDEVADSLSEVLNAIEQGDWHHPTLGDAIYELRRTQRDQAQDELVKDLATVVGWDSSSAQDFILVLTSDALWGYTPYQLDTLRARLRQLFAEFQIRAGR